MITTKSNLSWDDMRSQWISIDPFNLSPKTTKEFYRFNLPESMDQTSVFLNIVTRNGGFSGSIYIKRNNESFVFNSEIKNLKGKILNEGKK